MSKTYERELGDVGSVDFRTHGGRVFFLDVSDLAGGNFLLRDAAGLAGMAGNHGLGSVLQLAGAAGGYQDIAKIAVVLFFDTHDVLPPELLQAPLTAGQREPGRRRPLTPA